MMTWEMLCFTIDTGVGGRAGSLVSDGSCRVMFGFGRSSPHCNSGLGDCGAVLWREAIADS